LPSSLGASPPVFTKRIEPVFTGPFPRHRVCQARKGAI
jgi:hypothetical protein